MVSTVEKGDELEDKFHQYLLDQRDRGDLVYGAYSPNLCKICKKKKYYCRDREDYVTFDVVVEFYRQGGTSPHLYVVLSVRIIKERYQRVELPIFQTKLVEYFRMQSRGS